MLPCPDLTATVDFLATQLGFRVDMILPADAPETAVMSGHGMCLRLQQESQPHPVPITLRLSCHRATLPRASADALLPPAGLRIQWVDEADTDALPAAPTEGVISRNCASDWHEGRVGMQYRDLLPGRMNGHFIASHIRIPNGGKVPDYVHHHHVRFQMIYCKAGWARLVYEDQGAPFVMQAGDCVLQPPHIRHRVLEASSGLEVIEIGSPAVHETLSDSAMALPNGPPDPQRRFDGQRFVHYRADDARWQPSAGHPGFESRDTGIAAASDGVADVRVIRACADEGAVMKAVAAGELHLVYVLAGNVQIRNATLGEHTLGDEDCCAMPAAAPCALHAPSGATWLQVALPGHGNLR